MPLPARDAPSAPAGCDSDAPSQDKYLPPRCSLHQDDLCDNFRLLRKREGEKEEVKMGMFGN